MVLPNIKLLPTAVPNTLRVYKRGRQQRRQCQGCLIPTRNGLLCVIDQALRKAILDSTAPLSSRTMFLHQTRKNTRMWGSSLLKAHHTLTGVPSPLMEKGSHWACELTKLPLFTEQLFICRILSSPDTWKGTPLQKEESDPVLCSATWTS